MTFLTSLDVYGIQITKIPLAYFEGTRFSEIARVFMGSGPINDRLLTLSKQVNSDVVYKADDVGWGVDDKWTTPRETSLASYGDCEDIASVKFIIARAEGNVTVKMGYGIDVENFPTKIAHMVALAYLPGEQAPYILNNYSAAFEKFDKEKGFILLFVFDEKGFTETDRVKEFTPELIESYRRHILFHRKLFFEKLSDELRALHPA
jgi:hypothetical protein